MTDARPELTQDYHAKQFARALILGALGASEKIDRFSTWVLASTAGLFVFAFSNLYGIVAQLGERGVRWSMALLLTSMLCGIAQKYAAFRVSLSLSLTDSMEARLKENARDIAGDSNVDLLEYIHNNVNVGKSLAILVSAYPKFMQKALLSKLSEGVGDTDRPKKSDDLAAMTIQLASTYVQLGIGLAGLIVAIACV